MDNDELRKKLAENLASVTQRVGAACRRAGRRSDEVRIVAITKYCSARVAGLLHDAGISDLGESRPQELWKKAAELPASIRWHLVGHLQRNKVERTVPIVHLIHSVDNLRLLDALAHETPKNYRTVPILLEVNLSGEENKTGMSADELPMVIQKLKQMPSVHWSGLMTMAALQEAESCRGTFRSLRELRDRLFTSDRRGELSMGMSNDFEVAVEEGATLVRIGSSLFEGISAEALKA